MSNNKKITRAQATPLRGDDGGNTGTSHRWSRDFFDARNFSQIMREWREAVDPENKNTETFLTHLGLEGIVTAEQLEQLISGGEAAGKHLLVYLRERMRREPTPVATPAIFYHRGFSKLNDGNNRSTAIEITAEQLRNKRQADFLAFAQTLPPIVAGSDEAKEHDIKESDNAPLQRVVHWVQAQKPDRQDEVTEEAVREYIEALWKGNALGETSFVAPDEPAFEPTLHTWAQQEFSAQDKTQKHPQATRWQAGSMLRFLREYASLTQNALGTAIGVDTATIRDWERGAYNINASKLGNLIKELNLTEEEATQLTHARLPALNETWLKAQFADEDPQTRARKQAGLLLKDLREKHPNGITLVALGQLVGVNKATIGYCELGEFNINASKLGSLIQTLSLTEEEATQLINARFPTLKKEWLNQETIPEHKRGGLWLSDLLELANIERKQMRTLVNSNFFSGADAISQKKIPDVILFLRTAVSDDRQSELASISNKQLAIARQYINDETLAQLQAQIEKSNKAIHTNRQMKKVTRTQLGAVATTEQVEQAQGHGR
jgi:DNA-binding XRE family transcriptional regulator